MFVWGALRGLLIALIAVIGLIFFADAHLAELFYRSKDGVFALVALTFLLSLTFGAAEIAFSVLMLKNDDDDD